MLYDLAFHLKMPRYQMDNEMPYTELLGWYSYFEKRPPGWQDDDRTFKLLQAQGVKAKPDAIFPSLAKLYSAASEHKGLDSSFKNSYLFHKILGAKGGEKISC